MKIVRTFVALSFAAATFTACSGSKGVATTTETAPVATGQTEVATQQAPAGEQSKKLTTSGGNTEFREVKNVNTTRKEYVE